jgi:hypothetical protein
VLKRLRQALDPARPDPEYAHLPLAEKAAITQILKATFAGWRAGP